MKELPSVSRTETASDSTQPIGIPPIWARCRLGMSAPIFPPGCRGPHYPKSPVFVPLSGLSIMIR